MPTFGPTSSRRLATCHLDLQAICAEAIQLVDFAVLCGSRPKADQDVAVATGTSRAPWPSSAHNVDGVKRRTSWAVDLAPYPIDWQDVGRFVALRSHMEAVAGRLLAEGKIRHGLKPLLYLGRGRTKPDRPHFELAGVADGE